MRKDWIINNNDSNEKSLIKRLLNTRGIKTEAEIEEFLNPLNMKLTSPYVFSDMEKTVERISTAIKNEETIVIYGDFDADGVTSTSILYKTLKTLNANVHYHIPNRESDGHGLDNKSIVKLMTSIKPKLIITVDCGISNVEEVKFINSFKKDIIITDHHEAPETLPNAYAIINPKAPNALSENLTAKQIEHLTYLAGCGVAFKIAQALLTKYNRAEVINDILPFVAIGTIADVVPLLGENRHLVAKGLDLISRGKHEGITKLLTDAGIDITKGVTSENIAFGLAPRINASGRLDTGDVAIKVLISDNPQEVSVSIQQLNEFNKIRQKLCQDIFEQADAMVQKEGNKNPAIILYHEEWHIGIIGIVASKLVEKYYKPVFLMSYIEEKDQYRCSARSIEGVPLYDILSSNSELFDGFGGHKLAAGLSFSGEKTPFEIVKKALNDTIKEYSNKALKPFINIDLVVEANDITTDLIDTLAVLEPFGASNPSPIFAINNLKIKQKRIMGTDNSHLRLNVETGANEFTAIWWKRADAPLNTGDKLDIAFHPQLNEFNGTTSVQLIIDDVHSEAIPEDNIKTNSKYKIYDHRQKTGILPTVNDYVKKSKQNIKIFAESKNIVDNIKSFSALFDNKFTRQDIPKCDTIMFFDYPADRKTLDYILEKTQAKGLHFMNYSPIILDEQELLNKFVGMMKYSSNNNYGKFELVRCASFLGKSVKIIEMLLELFADFGVINIKERNSSFYIIEFTKFDNYEDILQNKKYNQIYDLMTECEDFQKSLLEDSLEELIS